MKRLICILIVVLVAYSCDNDEGRIGYDEIILKQFIIDNYTEDAKQLYMNEIFHDKRHFNHDKPIIDVNEVNKILKLIQAVYDSNSPERDTVFETYQIHGFYCYSLSSIGLKVNTALPEIQNLSEEIIPTGNAELDNLLTNYNFEVVETSYGYPDFPWLTIYSNKEFNMIPLEKRFNDLAPVLISEFNKSCVGGGNNISLTRSPYAATVTFNIGKGDCPAGCTYHKYWEFIVQDGKAEFIKSYEN